jgi:hypothetical protein
MRMQRRRARRRRAQKLGLPLVLAAIGGAIAAVALRVRARRAGPARETYRCECGEKFRVAGRDRHRIYWLAEAPEDEPVLGTTCPSCDRPLPQGTARDTVSPVAAPA